MHTPPDHTTPAARRSIRLDAPVRIALSGTVFPTSLHALIGAVTRDPAARAHVAAQALPALRGQWTPDADWERRRTEAHLAILLRHFVGRDAALTAAFIASGSEDLGDHLDPERHLDREHGPVIATATVLRFELQRMIAQLFPADLPVCANCTHARVAGNASVIACGRNGGTFTRPGHLEGNGPLGTLPYALGWGRPQARLGHTAARGLIVADMPLMQLHDRCGAYRLDDTCTLPLRREGQA